MGPALGRGDGQAASQGSSSSSVFLEVLNLSVEETGFREAEGDVFYKFQPNELSNNTEHP